MLGSLLQRWRENRELNRPVRSGTPGYPSPEDVIVHFIKPQTIVRLNQEWVGFSSPQAKKRWVQVAPDAQGGTVHINLMYPSDEEPRSHFAKLNIESPAGWTLESWNGGTYAEFTASTDDTRAIVSFIDGLYRKLYGCAANYVIEGSPGGP